MSKNWETRPFGDVCEIVGGSQPPKKDFLSEPNEGYVRLVQVRDYRTDKFITYIPKDKARRFCSVSDIMIGRYGPPIFGIFSGLEGAYNVALMKAIPNEELLDKEFFRWFLKTDELFRFVEKSSARAAGQSGVRKDVLYTYPTPIPPLEEQKQIVALLDKTFAAIDLAKANIEKNLQNAKELFQSKLNQIFTQKGEGWEEKKLGDESLVKMIDGDRGKNYPKKSDFFTEGHCVFMNTGNVRPNGFDFSNVMFITEERDNLLRKGKLQRNDVVMTTRGTIGNLGWYNKDVKYDEIRINSGMLIFRVNSEKVLPEFLFAVFRSPLVTKQIAEMTTGAAQPQLPIKTLVHFDIPIHSDLNKQKEMVSKIQEMELFQDKLIQVYNRKITNLDELKKSILQKAFTGELI